MLFLLLAVGALATTPAPTVPTPYPTITPAPESACNYQAFDQGPFALDCLQQTFIEAGCSPRGASYPTQTGLDAAGPTLVGTVGGDGLKLDKHWYNQQTWVEVQIALQSLYASTNTFQNTDCLGPITSNPTNPPTPEPTTLSPTPAPSHLPTTYTPAPTYGEDAGAYELASVSSGGAITDAELTAACVNGGYERQYDDTRYVVIVSNNGKTDYYTTPNEICQIFDGSETDVLVGNSVAGPFQSVADTTNRPSDEAYLSWIVASSVGDTTVSVTSYRTNPDCNEINVPMDDQFNIQLSGHICSASANPQWASVTHCSGDTLKERDIALAIQNHLTVDCDSTDITSIDGARGYSWSGACWADGAASTADFVVGTATENPGMQTRLCTARCDYVNEVYDAGNGACFSLTAAADASAALASCAGSAQASGPLNAGENAFITSMANGATMYLGNDLATWRTAGAMWTSGEAVAWTNFLGYSETTANVTQNLANPQLYLDSAGTWQYNSGDIAMPALCRADANMDESARAKDTATACSITATAANYQASGVDTSFPYLDQPNSGFMDGASPGDLSIAIKIPKTLYDVEITFENSTSDAAEYSASAYNPGLWTVTHDSSCGTDADYTLTVPWTTFNLGGAGGVDRLQSYKDTNGTTWNPDSEIESDGSNSKYIFGATVMVSATQPLKIEIDSLNAVGQRQKRQATWDRQVTARIPIIVKFQKTVTVSTNVDIVSTKFNYKTVAAIIQSVQFDTQYFQPPYAKVRLQIRTKSQYPYMMNPNNNTATLSVASTTTGSTTPVALNLAWLADDANCTFTNSDHMREGDICTQEWELTITPRSNVCYATGEYTITYETRCFYGKDVCYMPFDSAGNELTTVSFTFKVQTSKFCPDVADEITLGGQLEITGRNSYKPATDGVEGATPQDFYLQGETIYVLGTTSSDKAKIVATNVIMVEVHQDLSGLIQTGFNRVPFDVSQQELVVWTEGGSVADGTVNVQQDGQTYAVNAMDDSMVQNSDHTDANWAMLPTEAGFRINLHARLFPVNTDSFGSKTLVATLQVQYEAIGNTGRRRRLITTQTGLGGVPSKTDGQASVRASVQAWAPQSLPAGLSTAASMRLEMTVPAGSVLRSTASKFAASVKQAFVNGMNGDAMTTKIVTDDQVSIDQITADNTPFWTRVQHQGISSSPARRRLAGAAQTLQIDFTFAEVSTHNSMALYEMIQVFERQLKNPTSALLSEPIFKNAVIHTLDEIPTSNYSPPVTTSKLASSANALSLSLLAILLPLLC